MRRQLRLIDLRGNCGNDDRRTVFISDIILQYEHRPDSSLLGTDDGAQVGVINIATLY